MADAGSLLVYLRDPRLATHALSPLPAWLWSTDARHVLWANPVGAAIFDAPTSAALVGHTVDSKGTAALQMARLAGTLSQGGAPRLERLRGFGGRFGRALMCACSRVVLAERTPAILVVATEPAGPNLSLAERARRALAGCGEAVALFAADGALLAATEAGQARLGGAATLADLGEAGLADEALASGHATGQTLTIERVGADLSIALLASFAAEPENEPAPPTTASQASEPAAVVEPPAEPSTPATPIPPGEPAHATSSATAPAKARRHPLRFVWQTDADAHFTLGSDEFIALIGPRTAAALGRPWGDIDTDLRLDPDGQVARAFASQDTWSGITVAFPADDVAFRLPVELSGLPVFDRERSFRGYRGFGICRDIARMAELTRLRERQAPAAPPRPEPPAEPETRVEPPVFRDERPMLTVVPASENVVPFRAVSGPEKPPVLTPVERKAFRDLASRLTARLRRGDTPEAPEDVGDEPPQMEQAPSAVPDDQPLPAQDDSEHVEHGGPAGDQRPLLDRLPVGVLVYRLDKLIYANRAFLDWTGYHELYALERAGGLDALFVEPSADGLAEDGAKSLAIATNRGDRLPVEARLFSTPWEGESALVLVLASVNGQARHKADDAALVAAQAEAHELRAILDTATDGVVVLDRDGRTLSANRSAEALFGCGSGELLGLPFASLFTTESQRVALDELAAADRSAGGRMVNTGRELTGRARSGGTIPLFMTIGQITDGTDRLCAVFRDLAPWKKAEQELVDAKRNAEKASAAKSEFLAKVSHEIRTPLNAIIGFAEVMMQERFGPVGNDRYRQYLKDIQTSGAHLVSLLNDLLDLSKIEAGKLDLAFASIDLNEVTQQCVALMQPQANRERVIIRTSLAPSLPVVVADARSVRQIVLNLLSNSIKFTGAGGQVIVSTALNDNGEAALRVRDTGVGMSDQDIAIALQPFRQLATAPRSGGTGLGLPLTKALAEANRATFSIRSAVNAGTLVEVAFSGARIAAE